MKRWYLDTCSLINLYATGKLETIAADLGFTFLVVPKVYPEETVYIYAKSGGSRGEPEPIDLNDAIQKGVIREDVAPAGDESEVFIAYAMLLDDGEAMTIAAAELRGGGIITDDLRAWKVLQEHAPKVPRMTTLSLVKAWADVALPKSSVIREMFGEMQIRAKFIPSSKEPHYGWLQSIITSTSQGDDDS